MKRIILLYSLFIFLWASSCQKYLEKNPDMRAELDSPDKIRELLTNAYTKASYVAFAEAASDNAYDKGLEVAETPVNADPWKFNTVNSKDLDSPNYFWTRTYEAISAANIAIEAFGKLSKNLQADSSLIGEALVSRAFNHFMLVCLYAKMYDPITADVDPGVPYVKLPGKKVITKYERKTVAYVYDQIEEDLIKGIALLDDSKYKVPKYHFTRPAAHAFASRFYLFKQDYEKSAEHAVLAIGTDLKEYLRPLNQSSWRSMEYAAKRQFFCSPENKSNLLLIEVRSLLGRNMPGYRYGLTTELNSNLFYSGNVTSAGRYPYMLYGQITLYNHAKWYEHFVYSGLQSDWGYAYVTHVALTVDELILNRAEAYTHLGEYSKALNDLNTFASTKFFDGSNAGSYNPQTYLITESKVKSFYKTADLKEALIKTVLDFKRREFLFEGLRYFDLLRYKIPVVHTTFDNENRYVLGPNDPRRAFQMPEEVSLSGIENNPITDN